MDSTTISSLDIDPNEDVIVKRKDLMALLEIDIRWNSLWNYYLRSVKNLRKNVGLPDFPEGYLTDGLED